MTSYKSQIASLITVVLLLICFTLNAQTPKQPAIKDTLSSKIQQLKDIKITGTRPIIKQQADRIVYDLQLDPESKGNSVLSMIPKIPFLSLDASNTILMKGKSDYRIFINGRPSSMLERNPTEVLRNMPASSIQKIEVITNPSSKYDAEGLAGIINIITTSAMQNGYNGSLTLAAQFPVQGFGPGGSYNFKNGRLAIATYAGINTSRVPEVSSVLSRTSTGNIANLLTQQGFNKSNGRSAYAGSEISYEVDSLNLLSAQLNINGSNTDGHVSQLSQLQEERSLLQRYQLNNDNTVKGDGWDAGVNYQLGFRHHKTKLLTFSYRYYTFDNIFSSNVLFYDRFHTDEPDYRQDNKDQYKEQTAQIDFVQQIDKVSIEAGIKGILRNNEGNSMNTPGEANLFNNNQYIFGAYNTYAFTLRKWSVKAGIRLEKTIVDANFISTATQANQQYFNLIPTVSFFRKINLQHSINFGFSQRIKRPGINKLNPFVNRSNPNFETSGNPDLKPSLINALQLGYSSTKKLSMNLSLDYSFVNNIFIQMAEFNPQSQITRVTYQNIGKTAGISANFNFSYPFTKSWNIIVNGNGGYLWLDASNNERLTKIKIFTYNTTLSTGYILPRNWRLNASATVLSKNITTLQGTSNGYLRSSFSINKDLIKNKLSFSAIFLNPFHRYRENIITTADINFLQINNTRENFRNYNLSLNYRFGKLKEPLKKTRRGIKNDDLSN